MTNYDKGAHASSTTGRAIRLAQMMNDYLKTLTPPVRDRMMQIHLAQARGPAANAALLCNTTNTFLRIKKAQQEGGT